MNSIRIQKHDVNIEVNDNGDMICLPFSDRTFSNRFFDMIQNFETKKKELEKAEKTISSDDNDAKNKLDYEFHSYLKDQVDALFGKDTCKKVFGDILPVWDLYIDFFDALMPYFENYAKERTQRLSKYSPERKGNV